MESSLPKVNRWHISALFIAITLNYLMTLYPTVPGGDSGELISVTSTLGLAHPPGYPLYTLIGWLFSHIPLRTVAWRLNFFSAICDAGASVFLLLSTAQLTKKRSAGFCAAFLFAFSSSVWSTANSAEVFPLNNLLLSILVWIVVQFEQDRRAEWIIRFCFCLGLGISNSYTVIFVAVPLLIWMYVSAREEIFKFRTLIKATGFLTLGLLPYLYLPIRFPSHPLVSWGDFSSWNGFWIHVLRREYGTFTLLAQSQEDFLSQTFFYLKHLPRDLFYIGPILALFGVFMKVKSHSLNGFLRISLICYLGYLIIFNFLSGFPVKDFHAETVLSRFWQQANFLIAIWAGIGLAEFGALVPSKKTMLEIATWSMIVILGVVRFSKNDRYSVNAFDQFAKKILSNLPKNAILFTHGDLFINILRYEQAVEHFRGDVVILENELIFTSWFSKTINANYPGVRFPGPFYNAEGRGGYQMIDFLRANPDRAVFFVELPGEKDRTWEKLYRIEPAGFVSRFLPVEVPLDWRDYLNESVNDFSGLDASSLEKFPKGSWEKDLWNIYWSRSDRQARFLFEFGQKNKNVGVLRGAAYLMEGFASNNASIPPLYYKNLGMIYYGLIGVNVKEVTPKLIAAWKRYLEVAPRNDPDLTNIKGILHKP